MKKILVANRGEIALRIMRTAKRMGIRTVAVYSEADRNALHVRFADEAVFVGPDPAATSYLRGDFIIQKARELQVDGIHPGYGFLSENAGFAKAVTDAGIIFIGPTPEAMEIMGSKLAAKNAVKKFGIPLVPGTDTAIKDISEAREAVKKTGFPVLVKASAGGGGKGMRIVDREADLEDQMSRAISEAKAAFGDGSVFLEKYVTSPRHIEIQVLADQRGNMVHLFERECSIQRRHQKLIEESPSSILTPELRADMGRDAIYVAQSCGYTGAGTVEFLVDAELKYYFLEMNTRLQVEHPVTEFITGLDLVEQQIRVARGEKLGFSQSELTIEGHAMELRVCAEDPQNDFLPSVGVLTRYSPPAGIGIRVDNGYEEGMEIPIFYDPLLSKLIVHGSDRPDAIGKLKQAIMDFEIEGVQTTLAFGKFVMENEAFQKGDFDTNFIVKYFSKEAIAQKNSEESLVAGIMSVKLYLENKRKLAVPDTSSSHWAIRQQF